jgi:hypothetical protein
MIRTQCTIIPASQLKHYCSTLDRGQWCRLRVRTAAPQQPCKASPSKPPCWLQHATRLLRHEGKNMNSRHDPHLYVK